MPHISLDNYKVCISLNDVNSSDIDWSVTSFFNMVGAIFDEHSNLFTFEKPPYRKNLYQILNLVRFIIFLMTCQHHQKM